MTRPDLEAPLARITSLVEEFEGLPDPATRERARALVQAILDMHKVALRRLLELVAARGGGISEMARDDAVALLLALHGLHPDDLTTRVGAALEELRPRLRDENVELELEEVSEEEARVRVRRVGEVQAQGAVLRGLIETAIARSAPEVVAVTIVGLESSDVPLTRLLKK